MKVLISPFAQKLRNGKENPKNFPYWEELVLKMIVNGITPVQIGANKDAPIKGVTDFRQGLKLNQIRELIKECETWISVDSFLQHMNQYYDKKRGIVIFSQSDPRIFGYPTNINLLKDRSYLRDKQFWLWEQCEYNKEAFVSSDEVFFTLMKLLGNK